MDKIIVELYVPFLSCSYDLYIPIDLTIYEIIGLIKTLLLEETTNNYFTSKNLIIYQKESREVLNYYATPNQLKLKEGSQLILI